MADIRQELALGPVGGFGGGLCSAQVLLDSFLFGEVFDNFNESISRNYRLRVQDSWKGLSGIACPG